MRGTAEPILPIRHAKIEIRMRCRGRVFIACRTFATGTTASSTARLTVRPVSFQAHGDFRAAIRTASLICHLASGTMELRTFCGHLVTSCLFACHSNLPGGSNTDASLCCQDLF